MADQFHPITNMTKSKTKSGTVVAFNVSPKGSYEGFLLQVGEQIIQVNFSRHLSPLIANSVKTGDTITAKVAEENAHSEAAHTVFQLVDLTTGTGKLKLSTAAIDPDAPYKFSSVVRSLNYALHGEVNGAILESGDFLHLKPAGAKAFELAEGFKVKGVGKTRPMVGGRLVIEAEQVNGKPVEHKAKGKKKPVKKHL